MKIRFLRPWYNPDTRKTISKGAIADFIRQHALWLIEKGYGVEESENVPAVEQSSKDQLIEKKADEPKVKYKRPRPKKTDPNK